MNEEKLAKAAELCDEELEKVTGGGIDAPHLELPHLEPPHLEPPHFEPPHSERSRYEVEPYVYVICPHCKKGISGKKSEVDEHIANCKETPLDVGDYATAQYYLN